MERPEPTIGEADTGVAGLYVHLPFCARICPYCDFAVTVGGHSARQSLIGALLSEIGRTQIRFSHPIDSVYFGGGTPSLMATASLATLLEELRARFSISDGCRVTFEANPEDVDRATLMAWRDLGVTTLSLGVQSLEADALDFLGRRHTPEQARRAVTAAREAGFDTVSVDLIYARPGQTVAQWRAELDATAELEPDHISCYQLTIEPRTPFGQLAARGRLRSPPEGRQADLFAATHTHLAALGWQGYEVSNFARSAAHRSRHNMKYWSGAPYLGLGPGAHSFEAPKRWWNVRDSRDYVARLEAAGSPIEGSERLTVAQELLERVMLGLRTYAGIDLGSLERRFAIPIAELNAPQLTFWEERGWIRAEAEWIRPTVAGLAIADGLAAQLELPVSLDRKRG